MKKLILSALLICAFAFVGSSQYYSKDTVFLNKLIEGTGDQDFSVYVDIKNPSKYKDYSWYRVVNGIGSSWTTAVCDPFLCHGAEVNDAGFFMDSGTSAVMTVHFYMPDTDGGGQTGSVSIVLENDSTNVKDTAVFIIQVWNRRLNVETPGQNTFTVYPNPNTGSFNVKSEEAIESIEVIDLTGKVLLTENMNGNQTNNVEIKTDFIPTGLYLVRVRSTSGQVSTQKIETNK